MRPAGTFIERTAPRPAAGENRMHPFILFFIRAVLGVAIATLITRMFRGTVSVAYVAGLATVLVGLAYGLEYFRKRKSR